MAGIEEHNITEAEAQRLAAVPTGAAWLAGVVSRFDFRGLEQDRLDEETGYWERM